MTTEHVDPVDQVLAQIPDAPAPSRRYVVALAGPPAAGKSTLAASLQRRLGDRAVTFGLDAFHFDDVVLAARGDRARKGAPHTFDVDGYRVTLTRLRNEPNATIALPVFDRSLELSRAAAHIAEPHHRIVITEGNWLLLDVDPWRSLHPLFDTTVFVSASVEVLRARILERWLAHGFSGDEALRRADANDLPNAELVARGSNTADLVVSTE